MSAPAAISASSRKVGASLIGRPKTRTRWRSGHAVAARRSAASSTRRCSGTTSGAPAVIPAMRAMLAPRSVVGVVCIPLGVESAIAVPSPTLRTSSTEAPCAAWTTSVGTVGPSSITMPTTDPIGSTGAADSMVAPSRSIIAGSMSAVTNCQGTTRSMSTVGYEAASTTWASSGSAGGCAATTGAPGATSGTSNASCAPLADVHRCIRINPRRGCVLGHGWAAVKPLQTLLSPLRSLVGPGRPRATRLAGTCAGPIARRSSPPGSPRRRPRRR